ncbi:MAG: arginine--tRNA ligase, partial [Clostridiales bacterium]|nr:arginine--tRNA ligase [Candidatus Apopatousia equi]
NITLDCNNVNFENLIIETQDKKMGDYSLPCFSLAKELHKSPMMIAEEIKSTYKQTELVEKIEVVNGYVNFYLNKLYFNKLALEDMQSQSHYENKEFDGKTLCIDYSSINLAKYMHIGHLSTTMIGESLARIYESLGYKVVRINYIGDYGTPFGKMMHAYLSWGNEQELDNRGVDYLQELYVEFCKRAEEDESLEESAREYFKKIEEKDEKIYPIYKKFIEISKKEAKDILDSLGVHFDSWKGEASYTDKLNDVVSMLESKNLLSSSEGAKIVNLEEFDLGACLIQKSDGTSLYATRDIAAAIDRFNEYHFDKMFYITAVQQKLHFEQFFKVLNLAGYEFSDNLKHIYYGMFSLPTGKIASRRGKQAVLKDLMEYAYNKAYDILKDRTFTIESKENVAQKVALSALKFNALKNERIKDSVFDIENCFSFDGDTSAYMQYTYARISSVLRKAKVENFENIDYSYLNSPETFNLVFELNNYMNVLHKAMEQNEPSVLSKYALEICKLTNKFYMSEKVLSENVESTKAKAYVLKNVKETLAHLFNLICIETIEEM